MQSYTVRAFQAFIVLVLALGYSSTSLAQSDDHCGTEATLRYNLERAKSGRSIMAAPTMQSSIVSPSGRFKILFDTIGQNVATKAYVDSVAAYADAAFLLEIDTLGYKQPPFSFDDNMWYIYLVDKGASGIYGVTIQATQSPFGQSPSGLALFHSYIQIDNDFPDSVFKTHGTDGARITVFHEFHHVIQFGSLGLGTLTSDVIFREMTSVWLEMRSTPWVKDYLQYVPKYLQNIGQSFHRVDGQGYGQCIWPRYLAGKYGDSIVRNVWEWFSEKQTAVPPNYLSAFDSVLTNKGSSFCNDYDQFGSELMTAQMQGGSRLHQGKKTLPDLELYPANSLPIGIVGGDSTTFISPASLAFFQASTTDSSYGLVLSRNTNLAEDAQIDVHFSNNSLSWSGQFPETFCDNLISFPYLSITVFPQPFINSGNESARILASNRPYKPISSILDIYMVNNTLIRHLEVLPEAFGGSYYQNWDGRDDAGKLVQSGIYLYSILTDGVRSSGKISVITK